jgi:hypothetical protein
MGVGMQGSEDGAADGEGEEGGSGVSAAIRQILGQLETATLALLKDGSKVGWEKMGPEIGLNTAWILDDVRGTK